MPRLTSAEYYRRHRFLRFVWQRYQNLFASVPIDQQYDLHNFYQPDRYLTKPELLAYRKDIKQSDPGLPVRASKAYLKLHQAYRLVLADEKKKTAKTVPPKTYSHKHKSVKKVSVRAVARPEPNWDRFAFALLQYTKSLVKPPLLPRQKKDQGG